jgi:hypothetical protein
MAPRIQNPSAVVPKLLNVANRNDQNVAQLDWIFVIARSRKLVRATRVSSLVSSAAVSGSAGVPELCSARSRRPWIDPHRVRRRRPEDHNQGSHGRQQSAGGIVASEQVASVAASCTRLSPHVSQ